MNEERVVDFVEETWDSEIVPKLTEYIRIPNKSPEFDKGWEAAGHMQQAAELLLAWARSFDIEGTDARIVQLPGKTPVIVIDVPGSAPGNVLLYGHYDKQPEFSGWEDELGPWTPVLRDGRLYGRGGADDGYALFASLTAVAALQRQGQPHARCLILIEGCEESGSPDLPFYLEALEARIGTPDLVICLDAECANYDQLWLTTSLRGMVSGILTVNVLTEGVHSGMAGGIVPSSFRLLRSLLERIEDGATGTLDDVLSVQVPTWAVEQAKSVAATLGAGVVERFPWEGESRPDPASYADLVLANAWMGSLGVVGLSGAPEVKDAGNTLRPATAAKLVFRLPPSLDAAMAAHGIRTLIERDPPVGASVQLQLDAPHSGWYAPEFAPWLMESADRASRAFFRRPVRTMGCGGTIPFMKMLGDRFPDVQFVVTGVLGPHSNAHGPNEFLDIPTGKRVTSCMAAVLADHAARSR